ncbi:hypothetical protein NQ129_08070 [Priestia aryabhattai]|uniref:hypothetical protein n=1 Tax=Priestia aryabhattai TaxID=412384 RepID=UPI00211CEAE3|nr:hypothetical protein [Priestia aryabhattai]MCQ9281730.1 hypothetical protein [Priestia aryabhattai]
MKKTEQVLTKLKNEIKMQREVSSPLSEYEKTTLLKKIEIVGLIEEGYFESKEHLSKWLEIQATIERFKYVNLSHYFEFKSESGKPIITSFFEGVSKTTYVSFANNKLFMNDKEVDSVNTLLSLIEFDLLETSYKIAKEKEVENFKYDRQKKLAELLIGIIDSDIPKNYETEFAVFNSVLLFEYANVFDEFIHIEIGLQSDRQIYVTLHGEGIVFKSKSVESIVNYIKQQIDELESFGETDSKCVDIPDF